MPKTTKEWRCTRADLYKNCDGEDNPRSRQGHYVWAGTVGEAIAEMQQRFPKDNSVFDAELWKESVEVY